MASTLDDLGFVADKPAAVAPLDDLGFVPDKPAAIAPLKLDPLQAAKMQTGMMDPENAGENMGNLVRGSGTTGFAAATGGGLPGLVGAGLNALQEKVVEPAASTILNTLARNQDLERGVMPRSEDTFQPGKSVIPDEALPLAKEQGTIPALTRALQGFTTPGSLLTLPLAPESDLVKGLYFAGSASAIPDSMQKFAEAQTPEERRDAATELGLNVGMAALLRHGAEGPTIDVPSEVTPEQASANDAAVLASLPPGGPSRTVAPQENAVPAPNVEAAAPLKTATEAKPDDLADLGFVADKDQPQGKADVTGTVPAGAPEVATETPQAAAVALTPDGRVDVVQTAINDLKAQGETEPNAWETLHQPEEPKKTLTNPQSEIDEQVGLPENQGVNEKAAKRDAIVSDYNNKFSQIKNESVVDHQPAEDDMPEIWNIYSTAKGNDLQATVSKDKQGRFIVENERGSTIKWEKTPEDAIQEAKWYVESGANQDTYNLNQDTRGEIVNTIHVPADMELKYVQDTKWGSLYYKVQKVLSRDEDGEPNDVEDYKISIRDHEPSPFREKEFGAVDYWVEVPKNPTPEHLNEAVGKIEKWLQKRSDVEKPNVARIKTPLESRLTDAESGAASRSTSSQEGQLNAARQTSSSTAGDVALRTVPPIESSRMVSKPKESQTEKSVNPKATYIDKAEALAQKLESLKTGIAGGGQLHAFGLAADLWDRAVSVAQAAIRAGGSVADAIGAAIDHIKKHFTGTFDEAGARTALSEVANAVDRNKSTETDEEPPTPPEPGARSAEQVKSDTAQAEEDLKSAISDRPGKTKKEYQQAVAMATAKYRNLRHELLHHPAYAAENLQTLHNAVTEANAMLKPHGMSVRPEDYPNPEKLAKALTPEQYKRFQELQPEIDKAHGELVRMPKGLVSKAHDELQRAGKIPKTSPLETNAAGRTLSAMTDFLKKNNFESPKGTFAERLAIARRFSNLYEGVRDSVSRAWANSVGAWKAFVETYKHPPVDDDYRSAKKSWISYDQRTAVENYKYVKALTDKVKLPIRRKAMSVWLDADGDENVLKAQAESVPDNYRPIWETALKLTPDEKKIAMQVKADLATKLDDAIKTGLLDKGRQDYGMPQRWKTAPQTGAKPGLEENPKGTAGNPFAKLDTRDPFFSFQREVPSYFDGIMAKGEPENLDIGHLVSVYDEAFHKALGSRGFVGALQTARARDGTPVVQISGKAVTLRKGDESTTLVDGRAKPSSAVTTDGRPYRALDHPALKDWKFVTKDAAGNKVLVKGDMLVHPDHYADIKNELETPAWTRKAMPGEQRTAFQKIGYGALRTSAFLKASKFVGPFHIVTEALHASFHGVLPNVRGFDLNLDHPDQALLGRNMVLGFGRAREMFEDGLSSQRGIWAHVPGLGDLVVRMNDFTFNEYIPRLKMKVGLQVLARNRARYGAKLASEQIAELTGRQMDAAFGGQNWRLMGTNKNLLAVMRLGVLTPDFTLSRAKVLAQAFKPYNQEQRVFLLAQAVGVFALARVLNSAFSDNHDPHWEFKNWDSVIIGNRAYHARFLVSDAANFARDMIGAGSFNQNGLPFISGRLGVIPKMAIEATTGHDLFTGKPIHAFGAHPGALNAFLTVVRDTAEWSTPMFLDGYINGKPGQTGIGQVVAATTGIQSTKVRK